ncbi:MAG: toprim domain-containing protein [Verrucomicrobiae bacterium]|nr:toprim domain-containing protein [Verrucomicrobiae bacterium]
MSDLMGPSESRNGGHQPKAPRRIVATYPYHDETGALLFEVVRFDPKDFRQRRPDPSATDGWAWSLSGVRRVLFRLPEIRRAIESGTPVVVCEGEKDALRLVEMGFQATTAPAGAGKWTDAYSDSLAGADVYVVPDRDEPGRKHAEQVAKSLDGKANSVRVVELPAEWSGGPVKDVSDLFDGGATAGDFLALCESASEWAKLREGRKKSHGGNRRSEDASSKGNSCPMVTIQVGGAQGRTLPG